MLSVGLTGGIGAGKTSVARLFSEKGVMIMEADQIVHQLLRPGTAVWKQVISLFGPSILISINNEIDRERLAGFVFEDRKKLDRLLDILYPNLKAELINQMSMASKRGVGIFLLDASQILEAGWETIFDVIILVRASIDIRQHRLLKNGRLNLKQIRQRAIFQWPDWVKLRYADFLIDNSGPVWETKESVNFIYNQIVELTK